MQVTVSNRKTTEYPIYHVESHDEEVHIHSPQDNGTKIYIDGAAEPLMKRLEVIDRANTGFASHKIRKEAKEAEKFLFTFASNEFN